MDRTTIAQRVRTFITENYLLGREFNYEDSDSFLDHGIIDSIGVLQLVTFVQETYSVTVEDEELIPQNLDSIDALSDYICRKRNAVTERQPLATQPSVRGETA